MKTFNEQLLTDLFFDRIVTFDSELFSKFYDEIFPCPEIFISFLSSTTREEQIYYAKQILKRMTFYKYDSVIYDIYKNLLNLEEIYLTEKISGYVARDHAIHSINVYLLGIYLFFSFELFHRQLCTFFMRPEYFTIFSESKKEGAVLAFLSCWKIFSLNHDIGYPLELLVDKDGFLKDHSHEETINKLKEISRLMKKDCTLNQLVFLVAIQILSSQSVVSMETMLSQQAKDALDKIEFPFHDYVIMDNIFSLETYMYYHPAFSDIPVVVFAQNIHTKDVHFLRLNDAIGCNYSRNFNITNLNTEEIKLTNTQLFHDVDYTFTFCCPKNEMKYIINRCLPKHFTTHQKTIEETAVKVLSLNSLPYAGIKDHSTYMDFIFKIYELLSANPSINSNAGLLSPDYFENYASEFKQFICKNINETRFIVNTDVSVEDNLKQLLSEIALSFEDSKKSKYIHEFMSSCFLNNQFPSLSTIYKRLNTEYDQFLSGIQDSLFIIMERKANPQSNADDIIVKLQFDNPKFQEFIDSVCKDFGKRCHRSGLIPTPKDIQKVISYSTSYGSFDHGILSCFLVLETYFKAKRIESQIHGSSSSSFSFRSISDSLPADEILCTATYAILIHNIYVSFFNSISHENQYIKHDILRDPFTYFSLFCDNMQIWDRPYRINQGKIESKGVSISARNISIICTGNKLTIRCNTSNLKDIVNNYREQLDEYLLDGSKIILLNVNEI